MKFSKLSEKGCNKRERKVISNGEIKTNSFKRISSKGKKFIFQTKKSKFPIGVRSLQLQI